MKCFFVSIVNIVLVVIFHLQSTAGGIFSVTGDKLQPSFSVSLTDEQVHLLRKELETNARSVLTVHMMAGDVASELSVTGKYSLQGKQLSFKPLYPLGHDYCYEIRYANHDKKYKEKYCTPGVAVPKEKTSTVAIYPSADTIPFNILFFHVRFSSPMSEDITAYQHVNIRDENGKLIERTWRQRSFWLDSGRVLVLMIHPGRVKSGIHYTGPVFAEGKKFTVEVLKTLKDAHGNELKDNVEKNYWISHEDREIPAIVSTTQSVDAQSRQPVLVRFSEGMDYACLTEGVTVTDAKGNKIRILIRQHHNLDNIAEIVPVNPWKKGSYKIVFESMVTDFASNHLNRPFEIKDVAERAKDDIEVSRTVEVR